MTRSNSTPPPAIVEKLEIILTQCGAYAETIQRLAGLIAETSGQDKFSADNREHLAYAIDHISALMSFLTDEAEGLLRGLPETKPSITSMFIGPKYRELCEMEEANG